MPVRNLVQDGRRNKVTEGLLKDLTQLIFTCLKESFARLA